MKIKHKSCCHRRLSQNGMKPIQHYNNDFVYVLVAIQARVFATISRVTCWEPLVYIMIIGTSNSVSHSQKLIRTPVVDGTVLGFLTTFFFITKASSYQRVIVYRKFESWIRLYVSIKSCSFVTISILSFDDPRFEPTTI